MNIETKKYEGYWWLPSSPDNKITGYLSVNQDEGIKLKTIGSLVPQNTFFEAYSESKPELLSPGIMLGQTADGISITLVDSHCSTNSSTFISNTAIVGERHFEAQDNISFTSAKIEFNLLNEWLGKPIFNSSKETDSQNYRKKISLEYRMPEIIEFDVDSIDSRISTDYEFNSNPEPFSYRLSHKSFFKISPNTPQNLDWYSKRFSELRNFLVIVTGYPISPTKIVGYGDELHIDEDLKSKEEFQIFVSLPSSFLKVSEKHPSELLTRLPSLDTELSIMLNIWFQKNEVLFPSIVLYVATVSVNLGYSEFKLLNYAQALEALHRRVYGGKYMEEDEYEQVRATVVKAIPDSLERDHNNSLKSRIKYGNGFSQRKRIQILLNEVWEDCMEDFIDNKSFFVSRVVDTRNYLIHFDADSASNAASGSEIFYLAERLKILLIAHILLQLGIARDNVYRAILNFDEFNYLRRIIS